MKKQMKFYLALPLLALPFITIVFACMDGGKVQTDAVHTSSGLNTRLPDAHIVKDSTMDKMAFYAQATADSVKRIEQLKNDPYTPKAESQREEIQQSDVTTAEKIRSIRQRINLPEYYEPSPFENREKNQAKVNPVKEEKTTDPDLEAINQTIDKLAALQRPTKAVQSSNPKIENVLPVRASSDADETFFGRPDTANKLNNFYDGDNKPKTDASFSAIIPMSQTLQGGSVVKIQLSDRIVIGDKMIAKGTMVFGIASIENERLLIHIPSIKCENNIYPVALSVYDLDGLEGIYVPGSISRDVIKSTADQSLQSVNVLSLDPSLKTQAAIAGIGAAKSLLTRKVRQVKIRLESGYKILLKDKKLQ